MDIAYNSAELLCEALLRRCRSMKPAITHMSGQLQLYYIHVGQKSVERRREGGLIAEDISRVSSGGHSFHQE